MKTFGCTHFTAVRFTFLVASIYVGGGLSFLYNRECGGDLTTSQGQIQTPDHLISNYQHNADCKWKIRVEEGFVIKLKFINFQIESSSGCWADSLEVYDGGTKDSSNRIAKLCGNEKPDPIESSGNELLLRFHSDGSVNSLGFWLQYTTRVKCGGNLTSSTGEIRSPGFPLRYPEHADCRWTIRVEEGSRIKLTFTDFEVKPSRSWCNGDYLEIYNGRTKKPGNQIATLCGSDLPNPIMSSGNELFLRFSAFFSSNTYKGFKLQFITVTCGGDLTTSTGEIKSPRFPLSYPEKVDCEWKIRVEEDSWIKLTFTDFEVESSHECKYDSLEVYNVGIADANNRVAKLCGSDLPDPIESSGNELRLMFHSDGSINSKGFSLQFATIVPPQAPARFLVNATSSTSIRASWQLPPADFRNGIVRGYKLFYKKKGSAGSPTKLVINDGATLNKTVTGLAKFTEYEFQVSAFSFHYDGPKSSVKVEKTKEDVPSQAPASFSVIAVSSTSIRASWRLPPANSRNGIIKGYKLFYKKKHPVSSWNTMLTIHGGSNLTKTVTSLDKYTEYEFRLLAFTSVGDGPKGSLHVQRTEEDVPSRAPLNLSVTAVTSTSIFASWRLPPPDSRNGIIIGFKLFFKKNGSAGSPTRLFINGGLTLNKSVAGLAKFTEFEFQVLAFTYVGDGPKSFKKIQRTKEDVPSQAPVRFSVSPGSSTSIRATWQSPPEYFRNGIIGGYKMIYKKKGSAGSPTILVINDGATLNKTVTGLDKFTEYAFQVWAFTSVGDGRRSYVKFARTKEDVPSQAPANLSVTAASSTSIRASWQLPPADSRNGIIMGYKLFYKKKGYVGPPTWLPIANEATLANVTWLAKDTEYEFQVLAFTSVGDGPKSSVKVERTKEDVPSQAPASLLVTATSSTSIRASWQLPPVDSRNGIIKGYRLFYKKRGSADSATRLLIHDGASLVKNVTGLAKYTEYEFQVLASTSVGDGPKSPIKVEKTKRDD